MLSPSLSAAPGVKAIHSFNYVPSLSLSLSLSPLSISLSSPSEVFSFYPYVQPVHYPVALPLCTWFPSLDLLSCSHIFFFFVSGGTLHFFSFLFLLCSLSLSLSLPLTPHPSFSGNRHLQGFKYGVVFR